MRVRDIAPRLVRTIGPEATLDEAFDALRRYGIRQLPVVETGRLIGIVTDRDLRRPRLEGSVMTPAMLYRFDPGLRVRDVMTKSPKVVGPNTSVEEAARILLRLKVGGVPVVEADQLVGIVTTTDLLAVLVDDEGRAALSVESRA